MVAVDGHITVETIVAGKLRRYSKLSMVKQLLRFRTIVLPNIIDMGKLSIGTVQSVVKLIIWRPDVVFSKGGFVCLPVGIAARLLRIPVVIHDSDAHPGLTSRILSRWAVKIATGAPLKYYSYPKEKTKYVGVPVASNVTPFTPTKQRKTKQELGFNEHEPLVVVTGGGLGAATINETTIKLLPELLKITSVALIAGDAHAIEIKKIVKPGKNFQVHGYLPSEAMQQMLGAADIVVSRAGATTLLELAALAKPSIIIPNAYLTGGHQVKNAAVYKQAKAVVVLEDERVEARPSELFDAINTTLLNKATMRQLSENIHEFAKPEAAKQMARMIVEAAK